MEVFQAKFDYSKQRKDVISFRKGDKFYVIDKPNEEWWSARKLSDNSYGYVPAIYLEKSKEQIIGRLLPEGRINSTDPAANVKREHDIHLQALAELHQRVKPLPAHVIGHALGMNVPKEELPPPPYPAANPRQTPPPPVMSPPPPDYDIDDDEDLENGVPYHHQLNTSGRFIEVSEAGLGSEPPTMSPTAPPSYSHDRTDNDGLIQPKLLVNPVMSSPMHRDLHRELRTSGRNVLKSQDELTKVFRDRNQRRTKKEQDDEQKSRRTSLDVKLTQRLKLEEEKESLRNLETLEKAVVEPEFMKVQLKSRSGSGSGSGSGKR